MNIDFLISIGTPKKKLWKNKLKMFTFEALIHFVWTSDEKVVENLSFLGNLSIFLK